MNLRAAEEALARGDTLRAGEITDNLLFENPDDPGALIMQARILVECRRPAMARAIAMHAGAVHHLADDWRYKRMMGAVELHLQRIQEAEEWLLAAHEAEPTDRMTMSFLTSLYMESARVDDGLMWANRILELDPDHWHAKSAKGFALLHKRDWGNGWDFYDYGLGHLDWRVKHDYGLPEWQGQKDVDLLVYAEQGVGDQIVFCSSLRDVPAKQLVTHPKVAGLMTRTFPDLEVHGSQFEEPVKWPIACQYQASMAQIQRTVRRTAESFPGTAYLKPCPERALQWRATLSANCTDKFHRARKPRIGIAWTGGRQTSAGSRTRNLTPEQLAPIMTDDYYWIALEYSDKSEELERFPVPVQWYPRATVTDDLDDFAALIANLDAIVCVPTAAYHVAGALGIPAHVIVHETPHFHEGVEGDCPYWNSVKFHRRAELGLQGALEAAASGLKQLRKS